MAETENVAEVVQQEEIIQPQESQVAPESHSPEAQSPAKEVSDKEINFQKLREKADRLEREKAELQKFVERHTNTQPTPQKEVEEELGVGPDELVEGRVVKKLYDQLNRFKKAYEQEKAATIPEKLKSKFPDFDQVVTVENVEKLKHSEPELFSSISAGEDVYAKGVAAYKTLRSLGIAKDDPYKAQKEQVQNNQSRPLSTQAIKGQGALADANIFAKGLTPELRKQLQQEMADAVKAR